MGRPREVGWRLEKPFIEDRKLHDGDDYLPVSINSLNCMLTCSVATLVLLEVCVLVAVDERGEHVMSNETCRCYGKQQRRRRGGRSVQLPCWVMNKIKRQRVIALTWVTKMKSRS